MGLAVGDAVYVNKRRKFARFGLIVLGFCLVVVLGFAGWLYFRQPELINYVEVARQIENGNLDQLTIELMAVMLPIAMLMCLVLLTSVIALCWGWLSNEKRYLRIIDELDA